jgi:hypothetical protein
VSRGYVRSGSATGRSISASCDSRQKKNPRQQVARGCPSVDKGGWFAASFAGLFLAPIVSYFAQFPEGTRAMGQAAAPRGDAGEDVTSIALGSVGLIRQQYE